MPVSVLAMNDSIKLILDVRVYRLALLALRESYIIGWQEANRRFHAAVEALDPPPEAVDYKLSKTDKA